jgi:hypothetical protein
MPPIVDAGRRRRQAFGVYHANTGGVTAKNRPTGIWSPAAKSIFNSRSRLFWYVPFAVWSAKQVVAVGRVFQNSFIYGNCVCCFVAEWFNIKNWLFGNAASGLFNHDGTTKAGLVGVFLRL